MQTLVIGVAGGSASGKTTVVEKILKEYSKSQVRVLRHDDYYKDQSDLTMEERMKTNYDHPFAFDNELYAKHLTKLIKGEAIKKPIYDFTMHTRSDETETIKPAQIIICEGILVLEDEALRSLMDIKIFVDTDDDIRFIRRMQRDIVERGRTIDSVVNQYLNTVKPMHYAFVKPTKRYADIILPNDKENEVGIDLINSKIKSIISE